MGLLGASWAPHIENLPPNHSLIEKTYARNNTLSNECWPALVRLPSPQLAALAREAIYAGRFVIPSKYKFVVVVALWLASFRVSQQGAVRHITQIPRPSLKDAEAQPTPHVYNSRA